MFYRLFSFYLVSLLGTLSGFAQIEKVDNTFKTGNVDTTSVIRHEKKGMGIQPYSSEKGAKLHGIERNQFDVSPPNDYWLLPWNSTSDYSQSMFACDYAAYTNYGKVQARGLHQTYPIMGSLTYIQLMYSIDITSKLSVSGGFFASKYSLGRRIQKDFGLNFKTSYALHPYIGINGLFQHSFRQDIIDINSRIAPLFPNSHTEVNVEFKPSKNVKLKVGIINNLK